jgi:four helix bundle protein
VLPYKELIVWQKSFSLVLKVYKATRDFPDSEKFALQSQIRRASVSIPSNIAEGNQRGTEKDYASFLRIAQGSGAELETQLLLAKEIGYIPEGEYVGLERDLSEIMRILKTFLQKMSTNH